MLAAVVWILRDEISAHFSVDAARQELVEVFKAIPADATQQQVEIVLSSGRFTRLSVAKLEGEWLVSTPTTFGARNWVMWIEFTSNTVASLRIRTHDSRSEQPLMAPADREFLAQGKPSSNLAIERTWPFS
jgi:hypothetical protein